MRLKTLFVTVCAFFVCTTAFARNNKVYLYGFAASFNDSTVYFTDIRSGFLYGRDSYSYQLKDYLASIGFEHATCVTLWATTRDAVEKKFQKLRDRYVIIPGKKVSKKPIYNVKYLTTDEFKYQPVIPDENQVVAPVKKSKRK